MCPSSMKNHLDQSVSDFDEVSPATMAKAQFNDSVLGLVIPYICKGQNPKAQLFQKLEGKAGHK